MPTVAIEGQFRFVVNTRENGFEPPHVHVWVGNEDVCRIELNGGTYVDEPLPGNFRDILTVYSKYAGDIRRPWASIHGRQRMDAVLVRNADRMMLSAALTEDGIGLIFADGCRGVVPYVDLPEVGERSDVHALELPNPYEMILTTVLVLQRRVK